MKFEDCYTNAQRLIVDDVFEIQKEMTELMLTHAKAARDAIVSLPAKNEQGVDVVHGCNRVMEHIGETYYFSALSLSEKWNSRDLRAKLFAEHGFSTTGDFFRKAT